MEVIKNRSATGMNRRFNRKIFVNFYSVNILYEYTNYYFIDDSEDYLDGEVERALSYSFDKNL